MPAGGIIFPTTSRLRKDDGELVRRPKHITIPTRDTFDRRRAQTRATQSHGSRGGLGARKSDRVLCPVRRILEE